MSVIESPERVEGAVSAAGTRPLRVLIVEDDPQHAELIVRELRRAGFIPAWDRVETQDEYLAALTPAVDLVLADHNMPEFDSQRALDLLQQKELDIPFIVVSAAIPEEAAVALMRQGAVDYLLKDRLARLGPAVERALEERRLRREKQRADNEVRASEELYRGLFENASDLVYTSDLRGRFMSVNRAAERLTGYPRPELLAMTTAQLLAPDQREAALQRMRLKTTDSSPTVYTIEIVSKDGRRVPLEVSARLIFKDGIPVAIQGIGRDITERQRADREIRRRNEELQALYDLSRRVRQAQRADEMYPIIVEQAKSLLGAHHASLALLNPEREVLTRAYTVGIPTEKTGSTFPAAGTRSGEVARTGTPFVCEDFSAERVPVWMDASQYRALGPFTIVPVRSEQEIIGTLCLARPKAPDSPPFTDAEVRLLEGIAEIAGTAIRRARLHQNLQDAYVQMVLSLAQAMDSRDSYTGGHARRMVALAEGIARELGCAGREIEEIRWGARLHDIGKIGVPDVVLRKPGTLTEKEWIVMRQHPVLGEEILSTVEHMRGVAKLVRHHQEKWDGTGYPDRLRGDAIPLGARILAVVDAYGAITEARPYKSARTHAEAVAEIRQCAGSQFEPRVVDVFCALVERVREAAPETS